MNFDIFQQIYSSLSLFLTQTATFVIRLIAAYAIWVIGKFLINSAVELIKKADIKNFTLDDSIRNTLITIGRPVGKFVLILVILDFLGIGSSIIGAIAQGFTFTIAIALGLSFGEALKPEARAVVSRFKSEVNIKETESEINIEKNE